mmetsp:Transcript_15464/g.46420  ORF Transcript_15464/g.46420 Transcript_15464/m.46420 type:complete len:217 (-) Transcript_15464:295-945(-)
MESASHGQWGDLSAIAGTSGTRTTTTQSIFTGRASLEPPLLQMSSCHGVRSRTAPASGPLQRTNLFSSSSKKPGHEKPLPQAHRSFALLHVGQGGGTPSTRHSATRSKSSSFLPDFGRPFFASNACKNAAFFLDSSSFTPSIFLRFSPVSLSSGSSFLASSGALRFLPGGVVLPGDTNSPTSAGISPSPRQAAKTAARRPRSASVKLAAPPTSSRS